MVETPLTRARCTATTTGAPSSARERTRRTGTADRMGDRPAAAGAGGRLEPDAADSFAVGRRAGLWYGEYQGPTNGVRVMPYTPLLRERKATMHARRTPRDILIGLWCVLCVSVAWGGTRAIGVGGTDTPSTHGAKGTSPQTTTHQQEHRNRRQGTRRVRLEQTAPPLGSNLAGRKARTRPGGGVSGSGRGPAGVKRYSLSVGKP